jgi:hypothetical protein
MGLDIDGIGGAIAGDDGLRRFFKAAREAGLVAEGADVACAEGALDERLGKGLGDHGWAVQLDEAREFVDLVREVDAAASDLLQVEFGGWAGHEQTLAQLGTAGTLAALEELFDMRRIFEVAAAIPTTIMAGDFRTVADDADDALVGAEVDSLAYVFWRDLTLLRQG